MRLLSPALVLLMLVTLTGCPVNVGTPRYPKNQPASADLVGVYRPTADTRALLKTGGYADRETSITLNADGTFRIASIPDWWRTDSGKPGGGFVSGSGTWQIVKHQNWWALQLEFADTKEFSSPHSAGRLLTETNLVGQKPPYDITLTIGDPDGGREMRFTKVGVGTQGK